MGGCNGTLGREELPHVQGQGQKPGVPGCDGAGTARGATPCPRPGAAPGKSNSTSKERWLPQHRRAKRSYPTLKVRKGGGEEIPLVQG